MVLTDEVHLPTDAELATQEIRLSGAALRAGAFHLGKACEVANNVSVRIESECTRISRPLLSLNCARDKRLRVVHLEIVTNM